MTVLEGPLLGKDVHGYNLPFLFFFCILIILRMFKVSITCSHAQHWLYNFILQEHYVVFAVEERRYPNPFVVGPNPKL